MPADLLLGNYSISELEMLAVVWAIKHYRVYLYGHEITVATDHSAVKDTLEMPSPSGKHAHALVVKSF